MSLWVQFNLGTLLIILSLSVIVNGVTAQAGSEYEVPKIAWGNRDLSGFRLPLKGQKYCAVTKLLIRPMKIDQCDLS